jgi:hypothetical protein
MSTQSSPGRAANENAGIGSSARPYQPPHLTRVGSLRHLLGKSGSGDDGMSDNMQDPMGKGM